MGRDKEFGVTANLPSRSFVQSPAFGPPLPFPTPAPELQSKIGAGVEIPVLFSEVLDERSEQDPDGLRHSVL